MNVIRYEKDSDNIVHMIFDRPNAEANIMDAAFGQALAAFMAQLQADSGVAGVLLRSAKKTFFAGGDLDSLIRVTEDTAAEFFEMVEAIKANLRTLETSGVPVAAAINGTALGGGWELALACHYRVALNSDLLQLGLPEATLGLLPGAGGVTRMVRLLGLQGALPFLTEGRLFHPVKALELNLVHELADTPEDTVRQALDWIKTQAGIEVRQPWDRQGYTIPGGNPGAAEIAQTLPIVPALLKQRTKGCLPAPEAILCAAVEGAQVDIETATRIESRYFTELARGQVAKNMIGAFWYQLNAIKSGAGRPPYIERRKVKKVGVLGAGMMGSGIAYACAIRGIQVILKDVSTATALKGKSQAEGLLGKRVSRGRITEEEKAQTLALIQPTADADDLRDCELVIEAVFEDRALKAAVTQEAEARLADTSIVASNTSTLPITGLALASQRPQRFIGLHFFSPVDKMPLVEIICGENTDADTLARAYDFVQQIGKTPIVVNDSRGFYTSRVFGTYTLEGIAMLGEGIAAASIENGALLAGFPVGPLAVTDEVSLTLVAKVRSQTIKDLQAAGETYKPHPADVIVDRLLEQARAGKAAGKGFYEYPENGKKHLWQGLQEQFYRADAQIPLPDIKDRLLFIQAIETVRCVEENVLTTVRDANIGSLFGIGYPAWTGGTLQFINQYGLEKFVARAGKLADQYGERFAPPPLLLTMAEKGETFIDQAAA